MAIEVVQAAHTNEFAQYDGTNAQDVIDYLSDEQLVGEIVSQADGNATIKMSYWSSGVGVDYADVQILILETDDWVKISYPYIQVIKSDEFSSQYFIKNS